MPLERTAPIDFEYGYMEPTRVLHGHCTLRQALQFINDHQQDPETWTAKKIADDYKLKEPHVGKLIDLQTGIWIIYNLFTFAVNILHYFKTFSVYIPEKQYKEKWLSQAKQKLLNEKPTLEDKDSSRA